MSAVPKAVGPVLLACSGMTVMAGATIAPALPEISRHFQEAGNPLLVKLVLTMPAFMIVFTAPLAGFLADRFGRKRLLIVSLALYGCAGFSGYLAESLLFLLAGRALLGIGVGGIMSATTALIGDYFHGHQRNLFMGRQSATMYAGGVGLVMLGGTLADLSWKAPFLLYLAAFFLLPFVAVSVGERIPEQCKDGVYGRKGVGLRTLAGMVVVYGLVLLLMLFYYMIPVQVPFLMQQRFGLSSTATGVGVAASALAGSFSAIFYSRLRSLFGHGWIYVIGFCVVGTGFFAIGKAASYPGLLAGLAISGLGSGMLLPNGSLKLLELSPEVFRGRAAGIYTAVIFLGQFLSPLAMEPFIAAKGPQQVFVSASMAMGGIAILVFFLLSVFMRKGMNRGE